MRDNPPAKRPSLNDRARKSRSAEQRLSDAAVARYIADMTAELAMLAGSRRMAMLTYFLNMARVEAEQQLADRAQTAISPANLKAG